jgi:amino acid transporter
MNKIFNSITGFTKKLKPQVSSNNSEIKKFGVFGGVFTPDVLTILGVIMFLRLGWVVGNAGFLGAVAIILIAKLITICTALSLSSITSNIKIGAGGAYSIISKSLGLEAGGSIGVPFYISLTLSAALYIIGFTEGWLLIFPSHSPVIISSISCLVLLAISYTSAHFAIKIQYFIMVIIGLSLVSFILTPSESVDSFHLVGSFEDGDFLVVFAIFFPAVTGIMAGVNLSGDLKNPRKAIPLGTLSAIGVTMLIYVVIAYVAASHVSPIELRNNQMVMVEYAWWGPLVLLGILAATFSSALGSMIGAPRILQALAVQKTVPFSNFFKIKASNNEPRNAIIFTAIIVELSLVFGNLDALAALITMFFLITYGVINLVVFIQQSMKIISFRPAFKIPQFVSLTGALGCLFIMFLINPLFSLVGFIIIVVLYFWFGKRGLKAEGGDIRGGMFLVLAERASHIADKFPRHQISWKPDLLLPIDDPKIWAGPLLFIKNIAYPSGSIFAFTVRDSNIEETENELNELLKPIRDQNLSVHSAVLEDAEFLHGARLVIQTLNAGALRPNTLFLTLGSDKDNDGIIGELVNQSEKHQLGIIILRQHPRVAFGMQKNVNLWLRDKSPNWHLAVLVALQLQLNWDGKINLITSTTEENEKKKAQHFLERLSDQARMPSLTEFHVLTGDFKSVMKKAPAADINIFGLAGNLQLDFIREVPELINSSCLFIKDSGHESALA